MPAFADTGETPQRAIEFATTADGWDIALHRYPNPHSPRPPLIVCPGYACNRRFVDFDARYSLAQHLARGGFDVWVLDLRGRGASEARAGAAPTWTFDDLQRFDLPAAVTHVRRRAERAPVWIGHSMGGILAYAALGSAGPAAQSVAGLITLASPVVFPPVASRLARTFGEVLMALPFPRRLPQRAALVAFWAVMNRSRAAAAVGMNPANIDHAAFGRALRAFICDVPRTKLRQFIDWSLRGAFCSADGRIDYRANLRQINVPALVIAGAADRLATTDSVAAAFERIGSADKTWREFSAGNGDCADYGHVDLIFGTRAPEEVFRLIGTWLQERFDRSARA